GHWERGGGGGSSPTPPGTDGGGGLRRPAGPRLELGLLEHGGLERAREGDVVADRPDTTLAPRLEKPQPDLERAKAARVLEAETVVVERRLLAFGSERVVAGGIGEGVFERPAVAHEDAAGLERGIEPLVWVDRHRVGPRKGRERRRRLGEDRGRGAVSAVDVEPQIVFAADPRDLVQRIDRPRAHGP